MEIKNISLIIVLLVLHGRNILSDDGVLVLDYYKEKCPLAEEIVRRNVEIAVLKDPRMAASLLRLHFHDCFVMVGCDGSVLLDSFGGMVSEKLALPNIDSLRGFEVIDKIKHKLEEACPYTVSCADILALAARDAVVSRRGPTWPVPLGRRDSLKASFDGANQFIPSPNSSLETLIANFKQQGLDIGDLVALSGSHTMGKARCLSFRQRVYDISYVEYHDKYKRYTTFRKILRSICPKSARENELAPLDFVTHEFFKLPLEVKMACAQLPNTIEGYGQAFVVSEDQKLDWGDMLFLLAQPAYVRNMKLWPTNPPSFRASLEEYSRKLETVKICLLKSMARNLGLQPSKLAGLFEEGIQGVRMNYYPSCVMANRVLGLAPHSDATGLTILVQANQVQGLQIRKNGKWVPIKPLPGSFIINVGDIIEIMSNGEYKSIEHRAVVDPEKDRLSVASFHSPNMKAVIGPLPDLVTDKANYKTTTHEEYVQLVVTSKLDGKNLLSHMKLDP